MYQDFSSLPPEQEREFIVFEQRTRESAKSALTIGIVVAAIYGLLTVVVVFSHDKPKPLIEGEDIAGSSVLSNPAREPVAPTPAALPATEAPPAEAEATEATEAAEATGEATDAPADETAEPAADEAAEGAIEPPPPPPGATKAPPTAVVGQ